LISFFISILAFYLSKILITPIKEERLKLNNFIKDSTHELNTPITAILMSLEDEVPRPKQVERIKVSVKKISQIYKDLPYLFLENKVLHKDIKELDLSVLIKEHVKYIYPEIVQKKLSIRLTLVSTLYSIHEEDFERLFLNLLRNAIKYNKISGSIEIELKNKKLRIQDTGIGIQEDKIKDIFKRYKRFTKQEGGFGIGLNIVDYICHFYKIKISLSSQEKKGTTFNLDFS